MAVLKRPHTRNELRQTEASLTDPDILQLGGRVYIVRASRQKLPNAWDDIPISNLHNNGWKRHRKTQYHLPNTIPAGCQLPVNQNKWPDIF